MIKKHLKSIYSLAFLTFLSLLVSGQNKTIAELENELKELDSKKEIILNKLENEKLKQLRTDLKSYGLPKLAKEEELIEHSAMSLVYSEEHEQAKWVAHIITKDIINGKQGRSNDFRPDSLVKTGSAVEKDYFLKYVIWCTN